MRKRYNLHAKAQEYYETILSEPRTGTNITEGELMMCDGLLSNLVKRHNTSSIPCDNQSRRPDFIVHVLCETNYQGDPLWNGDI